VLAAHCVVEKYKFPINRDESQQLQQAVNQGHQPWRHDSRAVEGLVVHQFRAVTDNSDVYSVPLFTVSITAKQAVLIANYSLSTSHTVWF